MPQDIGEQARLEPRVVRRLAGEAAEGRAQPLVVAAVVGHPLGEGVEVCHAVREKGLEGVARHVVGQRLGRDQQQRQVQAHVGRVTRSTAEPYDVGEALARGSTHGLIVSHAASIGTSQPRRVPPQR